MASSSVEPARHVRSRFNAEFDQKKTDYIAEVGRFASGRPPRVGFMEEIIAGMRIRNVGANMRTGVVSLTAGGRSPASLDSSHQRPSIYKNLRTQKARTVSEHPPPQQIYKSNQLGGYLASGFQTLWEKKQLMDCIIVVEGQKFELHKGLLIALSPFFQSMFTSGFTEAAQSQVELKGLSPAGFQAVIEYLYTSQITISETSLQYIMEAAAHLQVPCVMDFCGDFITSRLTTNNVFDFLKLVHVYDHMPSLDAILNFISQNCNVLREREDFWALPADMLAQVLHSDLLPFVSEIEVLKVAVEWLSHNQEVEPEDALRVLSNVRYALIEAVTLREYIDKVPCLENNQQFKDLVEHALSYRDHLIDLPKIKPKAQYRSAQYSNSAVMFIDDNQSTPQRVNLYKVQENGQLQVMDSLKNLPDNIIFSAVVTLNDFIFVIGGRHMGGSLQAYTSVGDTYRFDFLSKEWVAVASMNEARALHGAAALNDDELIVIGGVPRHETLPAHYTKTVEIYNMRENKWRFTTDFPYKLCNIQACTLNGQVYAVGGTLDVEPWPHVNSYRMHIFDRTNSSWVEKSSMHCRKQWHLMMPCNDKIYVFGIVSLQDMQHMGQAGPFTFAKIVEYYTPATNQWTLVSLPRYMQHAIEPPLAAGFVIDNSIYVIGHRRLVEYDTDTGLWHQYDCEHNFANVKPVSVRIPALPPVPPQSCTTVL